MRVIPPPRGGTADPGRIKLIRDFAAWTFLKVVGSAILIFVIARVAIPDLVDAHNDLLAWLAVACGVAIPIIVGWLAVSLYLSIVRFRRRHSTFKGHGS
ncbi:MAG: hypothetical protein ACHP84_14020 [Caulobacterales bacterium]